MTPRLLEKRPAGRARTRAPACPKAGSSTQTPCQLAGALDAGAERLGERLLGGEALGEVGGRLAVVAEALQLRLAQDALARSARRSARAPSRCGRSRPRRCRRRRSPRAPRTIRRFISRTASRMPTNTARLHDGVADVQLAHARQARHRLHVEVVERVAGVEAHAERADRLARALDLLQLRDNGRALRVAALGVEGVRVGAGVDLADRGADALRRLDLLGSRRR